MDARPNPAREALARWCAQAKMLLAPRNLELRLRAEPLERAWKNHARELFWRWGRSHPGEAELLGRRVAAAGSSLGPAAPLAGFALLGARGTSPLPFFALLSLREPGPADMRPRWLATLDFDRSIPAPAGEPIPSRLAMEFAAFKEGIQLLRAEQLPMGRIDGAECMRLIAEQGAWGADLERGVAPLKDRSWMEFAGLAQQCMLAEDLESDLPQVSAPRTRAL